MSASWMPPSDRLASVPSASRSRSSRQRSSFWRKYSDLQRIHEVFGVRGPVIGGQESPSSSADPARFAGLPRRARALPPAAPTYAAAYSHASGPRQEPIQRSVRSLSARFMTVCRVGPVPRARASTIASTAASRGSAASGTTRRAPQRASQQPAPDPAPRQQRALQGRASPPQASRPRRRAARSCAISAARPPGARIRQPSIAPRPPHAVRPAADRRCRRGTRRTRHARAASARCRCGLPPPGPPIATSSTRLLLLPGPAARHFLPTRRPNAGTASARRWHGACPATPSMTRNSLTAPLLRTCRRTDVRRLPSCSACFAAAAGRPRGTRRCGSRTSRTSRACARTSSSATAWWSASTAPATSSTTPCSPAQSLIGMLERLGVNTRDQEAKLQTKNVAAVMVTADLPAFARSGSRIDVAVSALGDATRPHRRHAAGHAAARRGRRGLCGRPGRARHGRHRRPRRRPPRSRAACRPPAASPTAPRWSARSRFQPRPERTACASACAIPTSPPPRRIADGDQPRARRPARPRDRPAHGGARS